VFHGFDQGETYARTRNTGTKHNRKKYTPKIAKKKKKARHTRIDCKRTATPRATEVPKKGTVWWERSKQSSQRNFREKLLQGASSPRDKPKQPAKKKLPRKNRGKRKGLYERACIPSPGSKKQKRNAKQSRSEKINKNTSETNTKTPPPQQKTTGTVEKNRSLDI